MRWDRSRHASRSDEERVIRDILARTLPMRFSFLARMRPRSSGFFSANRASPVVLEVGKTGSLLVIELRGAVLSIKVASKLFGAGELGLRLHIGRHYHTSSLDEVDLVERCSKPLSEALTSPRVLSSGPFPGLFTLGEPHPS